MSRPRRLASQKKLEEPKLDLSDLSDNESDGDFSSESSDEYDPNKSKDKGEETIQNSSSDEGEQESLGEEEESFTNDIKKKNRKVPKSRNNRSIIATLRNQAINKFSNKLNSSSKLQDILKKAQFKDKKSVFSESEDENGKVPKFDCSGGLQLSDSNQSDSGDDENCKRKDKSVNVKKSSNVINESYNEESKKTMVDLKVIHDNLERIKKSKENLSNYALDNPNEKSNADDNIANLLAMGEASKISGYSQKRKKATQADDSDSDNWEEVEDDDSNVCTGPKESVEILLSSFGVQERKKDSKPVDVEAQLKRKFNRKRKEHQEHLHKTELMCWLSHCNYVNERLNHPEIMEYALKMLPSTKFKNQCYPKDKTDIDYFTQITKWFKQTVTLRNTRMYCEQLKKRPHLLLSLALQMKYKAAISRRDYTLMFVTLLRAIGIQCRMVQSLVLDPKICPKSELMSLSMKKHEDDKTKNSKQLTSKSSKSKSSKKLKLQQLDGINDEKHKEEKHKRGIRIKGSSVYEVNGSFIDVNSIDKPHASTSKQLQNNDVTKMSSKLKIKLNSPNTKISLSEKLKKNIEKTIEPNKTKLSQEPSLKKEKIQEPSSTSKSIDSNKKDLLNVFSPRRLRSRSKSIDIGSDKSISGKSSLKSIEHEVEHRPKKDRNLNYKSQNTRRGNSSKIDKEKKAPDVKKPNLKSLSQKSSSNVNSKSKGRLRSRSKSIDIQADKPLSQINTSRKRESTDEHEFENKKARIVRNSRKRSSTTKNDTVESKKLKNTPEKKVQEENDNFSDDSLKYFKNISSSKKIPKTSIENINESKPSTSCEIDRRVISSDDETQVEANMQSVSPKKSKGIDIWVEVYSEKDEKWISIDIFQGKVDCVKEICKKATHPLVYVFAWNNDKSVKDVSARYVTNLNTTIRKMRVERDYLNPLLKIFNSTYTRTKRDFKEDEELNKVQFDTPMPTSIAEFKNHPLYVLKRHLLKYEAIYPPEPPILGYIRDEAIYPRDCCFTLHSREIWLKEAKQVKLNEKPYKVVTTRRWDRSQNKMHKDIPLELFGPWQVKDFEPPVAENGIVPRNAYGNVELFKTSMLPIGTVHLQLPGLNKVCRKLGVDCAQAIVGFESSGGWPYPVYDGFIVCKEFEQKVFDAWNREQDEVEQKEREKYEKRVYGNWKKLIKGLIIRERLMQKYNNFEDHNK